MTRLEYATIGYNRIMAELLVISGSKFILDKANAMCSLSKKSFASALDRYVQDGDSELVRAAADSYKACMVKSISLVAESRVCDVCGEKDATVILVADDGFKQCSRCMLATDKVEML